MTKKKNLLNLKKNILMYMTYATLGITSLTGCQQVEETTVNYGTIRYNETIKYEDLKTYSLIEYIVDDNKEYVIAKSVFIDDKYEYIDVITGEVIDSTDISIICDNIEFYLEKLNKVKEEYNMEDIEIITYEMLLDEDINKLLPTEEKRTLKLN